MKINLKKLFSFGALLPFLLVIMSSSYANTVIYNINSPAHTFEGFGSMIYNSANQPANAGGSQVARLIAMHNDAPSLRMVRINHETRYYNTTLCGTDAPIYTDTNAYNEYVTYWNSCGDTGLTGTNSIEPTSGPGLQYIILGRVPNSFMTTGNVLPTGNLQSYANYLAAGVNDFCHKYGKCPAYVEMINEPNGNWSTSVATTDYATLVNLFYTALQGCVNCTTTVKIIGPGVSQLDFSGGDPYINQLNTTEVGQVGQWSVHAWLQSTSTSSCNTSNPTKNTLSENSCYGQTTLLNSVNWPSWASSVRNQISPSNPVKPIILTEYSSSATKFYYSSGSSKTFNAPAYETYTTVAYTVPFATRVYSNTLSLLAANVGPSASGVAPTPPYGASGTVYWQGADQYWESPGGGAALINGATNFSATPPALTPIYTSLSPLFKYVQIGSSVLKANVYQNQASDVFSAAFYNPATKCATVGIVNGTFSDLNGTRTTQITGLPSTSKVTSVIAKRFRQQCYTNTTACPFEPVLEDLSTSLSYTHANGITTFTTPNKINSYGMPRHSHLTVQFCYQ